jgi:YVTN family beta-propeller protein
MKRHRLAALLFGRHLLIRLIAISSLLLFSTCSPKQPQQQQSTANGLSNDVSVIDTSSNQVVATIKAGDGLWGVVIKP